jgi:potassium efflux system protein
MILEEPKPLALFLGFGDSTLNFELRAFIPSIDTLLSAKSELHFAIDKAFRAENITIAFPQRDLHIKTGEGLAEAIRQARPSLPNSSA